MDMDLDIYYDFVKDCLETDEQGNQRKKTNAQGEQEPDYKELNTIEKFIFYKNAEGKYDPDSASEKLQNVYKEKWNSVKSQWFMNEKMKENSNEKICSDTMTSVQVIINRAMKLYDENNEPKGQIMKLYKGNTSEDKEEKSQQHSLNDKAEEEEKNVKYEEEKSQQHSLNDKAEEEEKNVKDEEEKSQNYSYKVFNVVYNEKEGGKDIIEKLFEDTGITRLLKMYHTLGNYCPVPCYFNAARSGGGAMHDFWDLTLMKIREYYTECDGSEISIAKILGGLLHNSGNIITCKAWLDYFGKGEYGWENFIKENYLEDYIDDNNKVKPFWEGHSWKDSLPNDLDTLKDGVNEIVDRIEKRGNRILGKTEEEDKPSDTNVSKD